MCPLPFGLLDCDQIANTSPLSQAQGVPHPTLSYDLLGLSTTNYHLLILLHTSYFYYSLFNSRETAILYNFRGPSHLQMVSRVIYPTGASRPYSCSSWARLNPTLTILGGLSKCAGKMMMSSTKASGCSKATEIAPYQYNLALYATKLVSRLEVNFVHVQRRGTDKTSFIQSSIVANVKSGGFGYARQRCVE